MEDVINTWLDSVSGKDWVWYAKRLSANDTGATDSNQEGIYIPKPVLWSVFPSMKSGSNPDAFFNASVMPYQQDRTLRAIWYNNKTRNETRITRWNQPQRILDSDLTGGLVLFAFHLSSPEKDTNEAAIWICQGLAEENAIEDRVGPVDPGEGIVHHPSGNIEIGEPLPEPTLKGCSLSESEIPSEWLNTFPSGQTLVDHSLKRMPASSELSDARLLIRRNCESALFYSVERTSAMPRILAGFASVDEFVDYANSITNRRKSRSGKSLELHLKAIFMEEGLSFAHGDTSEGNKRPDFLFPHVTAYKDKAWPSKKLRMLASKTTCKDRWRQILNEADRIPSKHLVTLQQGVSENQFKEMTAAGVILVVPIGLHKSYPEPIRPKLLTLETFINETKIVCN